MASGKKSEGSTPTIVQKIAARVDEFDARSIPADVARQTRSLILDSIGCALAAVGEHANERALRTFLSLGGNPDCTVIGFPHRLPVTSAVMVNGILIRELDLNDAYIGPGQLGHPSDNIAVALTVGEKQSAPGAEVVAAVAAGYEIYCRIQDVTNSRGPWDHVTASAVGAPIIAGRLMKLGPDRLAHAMALSIAHGNTLSAVRSGQLSNAKAMANSFVAYQATLCVLLASQGATGPMEVFEGKRGFSEALLAGSDLTLLMEPIAGHFRITDVSIKAYPCIGTAQAMVAAALEARAGLSDPANQIESLEIRMADTPFVRGQVQDEHRRYPTSRETADHSFYYLAAAALIEGEMTEAQFENERWTRPAAKSLMERMSIRTDPELNVYTPGSFPCVLQVKLTNGESRTVEVFYPKGHPKNRMSPAELQAKFRACARRLLSDAQQTKIISLVNNLDTMGDVGELMRELAVDHEKSSEQGPRSRD